MLSLARTADGNDEKKFQHTTGGKQAAHARAVEAYPVGYRVIQVTAPDRLGRNRPIDVAVWYPSLDPAKPFRYINGQNEVSTLLAVNGKAATGPFPLVIHSHGASGSGLGSAFLTERLAREGFVVAAPDHTDKYFVSRIRAPVPIRDQLENLKVIDWILNLREIHFPKRPRASRKNFAYRPRQARAVINAMLAENKDPASPFHNLIDLERIGMVGHSFGAWTTMLMAGAETEYGDDRLKAVVPLSGPVFPNLFTDMEALKRLQKQENFVTLYLKDFGNPAL